MKYPFDCLTEAQKIVLPSSHHYQPSSSWPHRSWTVQLDWTPAPGRAGCHSTGCSPPPCLWSERRHLKGQPCMTEFDKSMFFKRSFWIVQKHTLTYRICPCNASAGGLHFWTSPPAASAEYWPPTLVWSGSRSLPLNKNTKIKIKLNKYKCIRIKYRQQVESCCSATHLLWPPWVGLYLVGMGLDQTTSSACWRCRSRQSWSSRGWRWLVTILCTETDWEKWWRVRLVEPENFWHF